MYLPEIDVQVTLTPTEFEDGYELHISSKNSLNKEENTYLELLPKRQIQKEGLFQTILVEAFEKFYARVASNDFREQLNESIEQIEEVKQ